MNPRQFEEYVCCHFRKNAYKADVTDYSGDYGVDVFAIKDEEKIAIQVKMYGNSTRKVNRQMIMELYGAKSYFDCTKAIVATDGRVLPDAIEVAKKLKIEILYFDQSNIENDIIIGANLKRLSFDHMWEKYIIPLEGKLLIKSGRENRVVKVDWGGIERITSNGNKGKIKIEIFKQTYNKLLNEGFITREEINQNYVGRASSGVVLILSQVPFIQVTEHPVGLRLK